MSETAKHTPGPWRLSRGQKRFDIIQEVHDSLGGPYDRCIATVWVSEFDPDHSEPIALKMTAAAELLEACEAMEAVIDGMSDGETVPSWNDMLQTVRDAVAKAEGQEVE